MKEEIDFYCFYLISEKIDHQKVVVHTSETFYKNYNISKVKQTFLFCKNWLVICTSSAHIRSNVTFSKKCQISLMPLINAALSLLFDT